MLGIGARDGMGRRSSVARVTPTRRTDSSPGLQDRGAFRLEDEVVEEEEERFRWIGNLRPVERLVAPSHGLEESEEWIRHLSVVARYQHTSQVEEEEEQEEEV